MRYLVALAFLLASPVSLAEAIPVEHFASLPAVRSPTVSPDGSKIAVMVRNDAGYYDIMVTPFGKNDFRAIASLREAYDRIEWFEWANNERLLVSASKPVDVSSFKFRTAKLYSIDVNSGESTQLIHRGGDRYSNYSWERRAMRNDDNVVSFLRDDPDHILVALRNENDTGPSVYKVNIYENTFEKIVTNTFHVERWYANLKGEVLLGIGYDPDNYENDLLRRFWYRESVESDWKLLREVEFGKGESFSPIGTVDDDGRILVFSDYKIGRTGIYRFNVKTGEFEDLVFAVDGYDVGAALLYEDRVVGASWTEDYSKRHYFDPADAKLVELVRNTFRGAQVYIEDHDRARKKLIIGAVRDNMPDRYYLLDLEKGKASFWFSEYPKLENAELASMQPFQYTARDGMELNGYLTLPVNAADEKPPLVVLPHGGPTARDTRYFDYWAQFLANRGYAVLQPNFRGSSGFGTAYKVAGYREWGMKMQDDVFDAIEWVKSEGLADTERMCIVGASYGGYVALHAATKTPEAFQCYVSIAGISDLEKMVMGESRFFSSEKSYALLVGDYHDDEDVKTMRRNSPINYVANIARPVLLIHGDQDTRVRHQQSEDFYDRARLLGKDVEYIRQKDGTHFQDFGPHRLETFQAIDKFLAEHLK